MKPQLAYYLKKDIRIYEKLDAPFDKIKTNVTQIPNHKHEKVEHTIYNAKSKK